MDVMISVGVIILAALTGATLQLSLGALLSLYHASHTRHISVKTKNLVGSFIAGVGVITLLSLATMTFLFERIFIEPFQAWILTAAIYFLFAVALFALFFYHRRGQNTELWIPRKLARFINNRAQTTEEDTEAFALGLLVSFAEYPFTLVLFLVTSNSLVQLPANLQLLLWAVYALITILPLLIFRFAIRHGKTVVDIQRWRVKNKFFFRVLTAICYLVLALFLIAFEVV